MQIQLIITDNKLVNPTLPNLRKQLVVSLKNVEISQMVKQNTKEVVAMKMMLQTMERSLSFEECHHSKKIYEVRQNLGYDLTIKLVAFVIATFQNSLKISNGLTAEEIMMAADDFVGVYTHDSINDLIFALRSAKTEGKQFYNKFSQQDLYSILKKHFEQKASWLEIEERTKPYKIPSTVDFEIQKILSTPKGQDGEKGDTAESFAMRMKREKATRMASTYQPPTLSENEYVELSKIRVFAED